MKRLLIKTIFLAVIASATFTYAEVVDKIVIVVNNEAITQREIDRLLEPVYQHYRTIYSGDDLVEKMEEASQKIVEQLIEDRLVLSEAKRLNIEVDEGQVEEKYEEVRKRVGSQAEFEKALAEQDLTVKGLKTRYREQMMTRKLVDQKVGSKISVSPAEINEYYQNHRADYVQPEEIKLRNILIRPKSEADVAKASELAKDILRRLKEGGDFESLAKEYSEGPYAQEGGLMGYVKKGDLLPEIEAVVFNMKEGEVSEIVQTSLGYHIFKVDQTKARRAKEMSEVRQEIEEAIFREKVKGKLKGWIEGLKKNAYIAFK